jgi:hypothetical protein
LWLGKLGLWLGKLGLWLGKLALLNQSMKRFLKALWLCSQFGEIIASFSNARILTCGMVEAGGEGGDRI